MGFSQAPKVSETENSSVENAALIALQREFDCYKKQSSAQKQHLIEQKKCVLQTLKEFLLNQAREVDRVHSKISGMKVHVASMEHDLAGESDIHARLNLVEKSLSELRGKYREKAQLFDRSKLPNDAEIEQAQNDNDLDPEVVRSEIATLHNIQSIVSNFYSELFASKEKSDYQLEVATAYEKLAKAEKQAAVCQQSVKALKREHEQRLASFETERNQMLKEKLDTCSSLKQVILLQLREAQAVSAELSHLKAGMNVDSQNQDSSGFGEMKVRLKLTETSLLALLKDNEEKGKMIEISISSSCDDAQGFHSDSSSNIDFSPCFAKVRRLREVLSYIQGQLKAAKADNDEKTEISAQQVKKENDHFHREISTLNQAIFSDEKRQKNQDRENLCKCMTELINDKKKDLDDVNERLAQFRQGQLSVQRNSSSEEENPENMSGMNEMEARLKMVEQALSKIGNAYEEAKTKLATAENHDIPDFKSNYAKVQRLGQILSTLQSQLKISASESFSQKTISELQQAADKKLDAMRRHFQDEKEAAFACLREIIALKESDTQLLRTKINKLKERNNVSVDEIEARLGLVDAALSDLRSECEAVQSTENDHAREVKPSSAKESLAKLNQLRGIMCLLRAQLNAAMFEDNDHHPSAKEKAVNQRLKIIREQLVEEKDNASSCLMDLLQKEENEAKVVQSKIIQLKEINVNVDEIETRLKLVVIALNGLRCECEGISKDIETDKNDELHKVEPSQTKQILAKIVRLRDIISFLDSQLDAAMLSAAAKYDYWDGVAGVNTNDAMIDLKQKLEQEKENVFSCLINEITQQEEETRIIRSKLDKLKSENVCVDEVETRLKLVQSALVAIRSTCKSSPGVGDPHENRISSEMQLTNAPESLAKLRSLRGILATLNSLLDGAVRPPHKNPELRCISDSKAQEEVNGMKKKLLEEKRNVLRCLMVDIRVQENEARFVGSKLDKLKSTNVCVDEMETRLKLAKGALRDLNSSCNSLMRDCDKMNDMEASQIKPNNANEILSRLNSLRCILAFLNSHLDAVLLADKAPSIFHSEARKELEKVEEIKRKFLAEKRNVFTCIITDIDLHENEARRVRSKLDQLKSSGVCVDEMETRLKLVEGALRDMFSSCQSSIQDCSEQNSLDASQIQPSTAEQDLARLRSLRSILAFLNSHIEATMDVSKNKSDSNSSAGTKAAMLNEMRHQVLQEKINVYMCLMANIDCQVNETRSSRSKLDKLKASGACAEEIDTRLKLVEGTLGSLRMFCQSSFNDCKKQTSSDYSEVGPSGAEELLSKLQRLGDIVASLNSQLDAVLRAKETKFDMNRKTQEMLNKLTGTFVEERNAVFACLLSGIEFQEFDARIVRSKLDELQSANVCVDEMEIRWKLVKDALDSLRSLCQSSVHDKQKFFDPSELRRSNGEEILAKLRSLCGILRFLNSHLDAALLAKKTRSGSNPVTAAKSEDVLKELKQKLVKEKSNAFTCLLANINLQRDEAQVVRSKLQELKSTNVCVDEIETRLKLAESALDNLHSECQSSVEDSKKHGYLAFSQTETSNAEEILAKLSRLRGIIAYLNSHLDATLSMRKKTTNPIALPANSTIFKTEETEQKFFQERNNVFICLIANIKMQQNEARLVRSKLESLKVAGVCVDEIEARLKLVEVALANHLAMCQSNSADRGGESMSSKMETSNAEHIHAKLNGLNSILTFLNNHLDATAACSKPSGSDVVTNTEAKEMLKEMEHKFLQEKKDVCTCLIGDVTLQENEARLVRFKLDKLKSTNVCVEEMETRLKLVEVALDNIRLKLESSRKDESAEPSNAQECLSQVNCLRGILLFLNTHLDAALTTSRGSSAAAETTDQETMNEMKRKFLHEKNSVYNCLISDITLQENEARLVRSKLDELKSSNCDVSEMEIRLKLVETAFCELRSSCKHSATDFTNTSNTEEVIAKLSRLRGILRSLNSHLDAISKPSTLNRDSGKAAKEEPNEMKNKFLHEKRSVFACLMSDINLQEQEANRVRSKLEQLTSRNICVADVETRLKLIEGALRELHAKCISTEDGSRLGEMELSSADEALAKLKNLRQILSFLNAHLDATLSSTKSPSEAVFVPREEAQSMANKIKQKLLHEKNNVYTCLKSYITLHEDEARLVRSKVEKLKSRNFCVDEVEIRLTLVEGALGDLRLQCQSSVHEIYDSSEIEPSNTEEILMKLRRLRGILAFFNSQLDAALLPKETQSGMKPDPEAKQQENRCDIKKKFLQEKNNVRMLLQSDIALQENEARCVRSKLDKLSSSNIRVDEMETRLKLVEVALGDLNLKLNEQGSFATTELTSTNAQEIHAKIKSLRGVLAFLNSHLDASLFATHHPKADLIPRQKAQESVNDLTRELDRERNNMQTFLVMAITWQGSETRLLRSKLDILKASNVCADEMETRVKLVEVALAELRDACVNSKQLESTDTEICISKLHRLRSILSFLNTHLDWSVSSLHKAHDDFPSVVKSAENANEVRRQQVLFLDNDKTFERETKLDVGQKDQLSVFLAEVRSTEEETRLLHSKIDALEAQGTGFDEIKTRLKLVEGGLSEIRFDAERENADLNTCFAKLNQLRSMIGFFNAQVSAVMPESPLHDFHEEKRQEISVQRPENDLLRAWEDFCEGRGNTSASLLELIEFHELKVKLMRSIMESGKLLGCREIDPMDTKLRDLEDGLLRLRRDAVGVAVNAAEAASAHDLPATSMAKVLAEASRLFDRISAQEGQISVVYSANDQQSKNTTSRSISTVEVRKCNNENSSISQRDDRMKKMTEIIGFQYQQLLRLKINIVHRVSVIWPTAILICRILFYGFLLAWAIYFVHGWERSMTPFNIMCSPALPGERITEHSGVLAAPFWVPNYLKKPFFEKFCSDVPHIRLEIKDKNFVVTETDRDAKRSASIAGRKRKSRWNSFDWGSARKKELIPSEKIRRYPAKLAYVTLTNILTADSDGWHEVPLPWAGEKRRSIEKPQYQRKGKYFI